MEKLNMFMLDFGFTDPLWGYLTFGFLAIMLLVSLYSFTHPQESDYDRGYREGLKASQGGQASGKKRGR